MKIALDSPCLGVQEGDHSWEEYLPCRNFSLPFGPKDVFSKKRSGPESNPQLQGGGQLGPGQSSSREAGCAVPERLQRVLARGSTAQWDAGSQVHSLVPLCSWRKPEPARSTLAGLRKPARTITGKAGRGERKLEKNKHFLAFYLEPNSISAMLTSQPLPPAPFSSSCVESDSLPT